MKLYELLDVSELALEVQNGYVKFQTHPTEPLWIYNYTDKTTWEKHWTPVTRQCRGLIINADTGDVVARPFAKFFNYGEIDSLTQLVDAEDAGLLDMAAAVETTDKWDGSLAILYQEPNSKRWSIATRGSFASEQAKWATEFMRETYPDFRPLHGHTMLFEIIYPENRIVVDYFGMRDLVLLGAVNIKTGDTIGPQVIDNWQGPRTATFNAPTLAAALLLEPRPNAEGVVVRYLSGKAKGERVKIKQADYVQLHRLVTGLNARVVWERMGAGETVVDITRGLPEEFWPWVDEVAAELQEEHEAIFKAAVNEHYRILRELQYFTEVLPAKDLRREYAAHAVKSEYKAWLFMLLDDRDPLPAIWKTLKPSGERRLMALSEDTA